MGLVNYIQRKLLIIYFKLIIEEIFTKTDKMTKNGGVLDVILIVLVNRK